MTEYVVIGDGAAGTTTAQYIRKRDPDGRITIVSDDPNAAYYRAALTNYLIGELREDQLFAVPPDFYTRNRIQRVLARVASIDTVARRITLTSGGAPVAYDRLCIAAGSTPNAPRFAGADLAGVMTMRTMQDARTFMEDLRSGRVKRAVVIGGDPSRSNGRRVCARAAPRSPTSCGAATSWGGSSTRRVRTWWPRACARSGATCGWTRRSPR